MPGNDSHCNDDYDGQPHGKSANIVQPFTEVQTDDVDECDDRQGHNGERNKHMSVTRQMTPSTSPNEQSVTGSEIEDRRKVWQIAGPINPRAQKSSEFAEGHLGPNIHATFVGMARGQLDHRQCEWRVKREPGGKPDDNCARPCAGG